MQAAIGAYRAMMDQIQQEIQARLPQPQNQAQRPPRHDPLIITAENIIANNDNNSMKTLTNFTTQEFVHVYGMVEQVIKEGMHSDSLLTPQTRFLLTLTW